MEKERDRGNYFRFRALGDRLHFLPRPPLPPREEIISSPFRYARDMSDDRCATYFHIVTSRDGRNLEEILPLMEIRQTFIDILVTIFLLKF